MNLILDYKVIFVILTFYGCATDVSTPNDNDQQNGDNNGNGNEVAQFQCYPEDEDFNYSLYPLGPDNVPVGDVMPFYDHASNSFYIPYLLDIWDTQTNELHPIYSFSTQDYVQFEKLSTGEIIGSSSDPCDQDYAIGTGSFIEKDGLYYGFYTGHNPNHPSECTETKEGAMLATSHSINTAFEKRSDFETIYAPTDRSFDHNDNFRDPFVYHDPASNKYYMILTARKHYRGEWRGVIPQFVSEDLLNWSYNGILYDGDDMNFFNMEVPEIFEIDGTFYLLFSDQGSRYVYYRKSNSMHGPWEKPSDKDRFVGYGIYGARTASDGHTRYISGWTHIKQGHNDAGTPLWGGNLINHQIYKTSNDDLAVMMPEQLRIHMNRRDYDFKIFREYGSISYIESEENSYLLGTGEESSFSSLVINPIDLDQYHISTTINFSESEKDFGFMFGACDEHNDFFSLSFVPDENRIRVDKRPRNNIVDSTEPYNDVPLNIKPNTDYDVDIIIENSMVVIYVNDKVALSSRIYRAKNNHWGIFADQSNVTFEDLQVTSP